MPTRSPGAGRPGSLDEARELVALVSSLSDAGDSLSAAAVAERLGVKNLLLYHTEDKNIKNRKELYTAEGRRYYHGNLYIPDDMETIEL